jgi:signal transduction histidine kinase
VISEASTQLARVNLNLQSYSAEVERQAALQERARITRELHDTIGYAMTNQIMLMEVARRLAERGDAKDELVELIEQSREKAHSGLNEARAALHALRAVRTSEVGAIDRIRLLIEAFKHTEVEVELDTKNVLPRHLTGELNYVVYRVVQEGITNAIRHGHASRIEVSLWNSEHELVITVTDNGEGASEIKTGVGFAGIQERIASRGGAVTMRNLSRGFQLDVRIPHHEA